MNRYPIQFLILSLVCVLGVGAQAVEFAGGTGQADDPYQIATAEQLISIGSDSDLLKSHFVLIADIDLDPNLSEDYNFTDSPISDFWGVFDGRGHRIQHLTITDTSEHGYLCCGLFQSIYVIAEVKRLILEDVHIVSTSTAYVGALCGENEGLISQCAVTGVVSGSSCVGGVAGSSEGMIEQCSSVCVVSGRYCGGLVGRNWGNVQDSYTSGRVSEVQTVRVMIGGVAGDGSVVRCYSDCQIESTSENSGGLVGDIYGHAVNSYFLHPSDGGGPDNGVGTPLTVEQMRDPGSFNGWDFWETGGNDLRGLWYIHDGSYPELVWQVVTPVFRVKGLPVAEACEAIETDGAKVSAVVYDYDFDTPAGYVITGRPHSGSALGDAFAVVVSLGPYDWTANPGIGTAESPYLIFSAGQLDALTHEPELWDKHFRLASDLDLAWRIHKRALIGHSDWGGVVFEGTFDGNGHLITNLTIEGVRTTGSGVRYPRLGLFGEVGGFGCIRDLGLEGVSVRGQGGYGHIGGMMCGINQGRIERSYCIGYLGGNLEFGGLAGKNRGVIEDCYAQGRVWRMDTMLEVDCAGLVGCNDGGTIQTCYAACAVPSNGGAGLVGRNDAGSANEYNLWDGEISGAQGSDGGWGVSTEQLMSLEFLEGLGWGNSGNWTIDDGSDYPRLVWERRPGDLIPPSETGL